VVRSHERSDLHGIDQAQAVLDAAFGYQLFDLIGDVDVIAAIGRVEPKLLAQVLHAGVLGSGRSAVNQEMVDRAFAGPKPPPSWRLANGGCR